MLTATLSKAGLGFVAVIAVGGIENLPALAGRNTDQSPDRTPLSALVSAPQTTTESSNLPTGNIDRITARNPKKPEGLIARLFTGSACDYGASEADLVVSGDRITLRVFVEAANGTERFERRDLSGTFTVDAAGKIAVAGIGRLFIAGQALACVAAPVVAALDSEMSVAATVTASFDARPPVLIQGSVIAPGSYEFSPNLSVRALLAKAGAGGGTADSSLYRALDARNNELRTLRAGLTLRNARLTAQRDGATVLDLQTDVINTIRQQLGSERVKGETAVLQTAFDETTLRQARDNAIRADLESALRIATTRRSLVRSRYEELDQVRIKLETRLNAECRGRCGANRKYEELRLDSLSGRLGDLDLIVEDSESRVVGARHALDRHDRDVALISAQENNRLALAVAETLADKNALNAEIISVEAQIMDLGGKGNRTIRVERSRGAETQTFRVNKNFLLLPGDLVIVGPGDDAILAQAKGSSQ